jgi:hypothetical protein
MRNAMPFFISIFRILGILFSGIGNFIALIFWIRLRRRNKRAKISTATLLKLREHLREHAGTRVVVKLTLIQTKVLGGVDAYHVTIPNFLGGWDHATTHCVFIKQEILDGFYTYIERPDGLVFTLLDEEMGDMSNERLLILGDKKIKHMKETAFAFVLRLKAKEKKKENAKNGNRSQIHKPPRA